jgi:thioredoxin-related protein
LAPGTGVAPNAARREPVRIVLEFWRTFAPGSPAFEDFVRFSRRFALLPLLLLVGCAGPVRAADLPWKSWNAGMAEARASGRPVLVNVYTDWCTWCRRMDRDVYSRADVREYLAKKFVTIKLDAESTERATFEDRPTTLSAIAQRFRVSAYPTTIFLRSNGDHVVNVPGYVTAERFMLMLEYVGDDHIGRGVKWSDFERRLGAASGR